MGTGTRTLRKIKEKLIRAPILQYYGVRKPVTISVDSSMSGTGGVILQNNLPIAYASKALTEAQQRYSQLKKEMFAICFGLTRFHDYIYGKQDVSVETGHLPLLGGFKKPLNKWPARLQRMLIQWDWQQPVSIVALHSSLGIICTVSRNTPLLL